MSNDTEHVDPIAPWHVQHVLNNRGHRTEAALNQPSRCLMCGAVDASAWLEISRQGNS